MNQIQQHIQRLREVSHWTESSDDANDLHQAAEAMEQQQREIDRLRAALVSAQDTLRRSRNYPNEMWEDASTEGWDESIVVEMERIDIILSLNKEASPSIDYKARYDSLVELTELLYETLGMRAASCVKMLEGELPLDQRNRVSGKYEAYSNVKGEVKMLIPHGEVSRDERD